MKKIKIDEDEIWNKLAEERDTKDAKYLSHEEFWKQAMKEKN